jgi:hypothetical protein
MTMRSFLTVLVSVSMLSSLVGCASVAKLDTPSGFATLESDDAFAYRALSAKGVVVATRTEKNELKGNTEFWAESIDQKLLRAGYIKQSEKTVKASSGLEGRQLRYTVERNGREHRYWVTVFLKGKRVVVVEAAGDTQHFVPLEATLERTITTLRAD